MVSMKIVTDKLRELHFQKKYNFWFLSLDQVILKVHFQKSRFGDEIHINIGIVFFDDDRGGAIGKRFDKSNLRGRIASFLRSASIPFDWDMLCFDDDDKIDYVVSLMQEHIIPLANQLNNPTFAEHFIRNCDPNVFFLYATIDEVVQWLSGFKSKTQQGDEGEKQ